MTNEAHVPLSREQASKLGPADLESFRATRYRGDDQAIDQADVSAEDRATILAVYELLGRIEAFVAEPKELGALREFIASEKPEALLFAIRRLGAHIDDPAVAEAMHDVRGGALTSLFVQLARIQRVANIADGTRSLAIAVHDHRKVMRNVIRDLDPALRVRDLEPRAHTVFELAHALRAFSASRGDSPVLVHVDCAEDAVIAESCVEFATIERVVYNLLDNAVRHATQPTIGVWVLRLEGQLRVVIANSISVEQQVIVADALEREPLALFGSFTSTGSGHGLHIVCELVGHAYGISSTEALVERGYLGARVVGDAFVSWFHWPLATT